MSETHVNVEGVCLMMKISRKTFYKNHWGINVRGLAPAFPNPTWLASKRGLWWRRDEIERYKARMK